MKAAEPAEKYKSRKPECLHTRQLYISTAVAWIVQQETNSHPKSIWWWGENLKVNVCLLSSFGMSVFPPRIYGEKESMVACKNIREFCSKQLEENNGFLNHQKQYGCLDTPTSLQCGHQALFNSVMSFNGCVFHCGPQVKTTSWLCWKFLRF